MSPVAAYYVLVATEVAEAATTRHGRVAELPRPSLSARIAAALARVAGAGRTAASQPA